MKRVVLVILSLLFYSSLDARVIEGVIRDKETNEPLIGVSLNIKGTFQWATTDLDGKYKIEDASNGCSLEIKYISYKSILLENIKLDIGETTILNFELEADQQLLSEVVVVARKTLETINSLKNERINSTVSVENLGTQEMSIKGISNAEDGVKKITGISLHQGQLFVRGLGDRYSITTLNGLPIASPNPDNKIIPLDIFPSSTISNITVSKVFQVSSFADYSGAHINIDTRENIGNDFLKLSLSTGGQLNALFNTFYKSDNQTMFTSNNIPKSIIDMKPSQFSEYIRSNDIFGADFSIRKTTALPDFGFSLSGGKTWYLGDDELSILASVSASNSFEAKLDNYIATLTAQGDVLNEFDYDSYSQELKIAALTSIGYVFSNNDRINYTLFYARNAIDDYKRREGFDSEGINLIGSNSVFHAYSLLNNQLSGEHSFADRLMLNWSASYGRTRSDEPDRRQVMFRQDGETLSLFKLNRQETMRYYGELMEEELVGDFKLEYEFLEDNLVSMGGSYRNKKRDYTSTRFYYDLRDIDPVISNIYDTDDYLNQGNINNGLITITKDAQPKSNYFAGNTILAGFIDAEYHIIPDLLLNLGVRYEYSKQWVRYWNDASIEKLSELNKGDLFPAINLKYDLNKQNTLRLSASKTITRPSFIEMAPFLYKESYGSAEVRGNDKLQNGYNYNIDLRYDLFMASSNDMVSMTGYYKYLSTPIERVQESSGGTAVHSFRNAENGIAAGVELELKKSIVPSLGFGLNASYMYTNVLLPENGGVYTDSKRALQGASPYLVNADITYMPRFGEDSNMSISLLYNLQGPRIETVGIYGMSNIVQKEFHTLDFVANYKLNKSWSFNFQFENILNSKRVFTQDVTGESVEVERYYHGVKFNIGVSFSL